MKRLLLLLMALLWAGTAQARTFIVWNDARMDSANANSWPGDINLVYGCTYTSSIAPVRSGTVGNLISYIGSIDSLADRIVPAITLTGKSYISVKGVTCTGDATIITNAFYDSLSYSTVKNAIHLNGSERIVVYRDSIGDGVGNDWLEAENTGNTVGETPDSTAYCTIRGNTFNLRYTNHLVRLRRFISNTVDSNTFSMMIPITDVAGVMMYTCSNNIFKDNKFTARTGSAKVDPGTYILNIRDRCRFNTFLRDTFLTGTPSVDVIKLHFSEAGNEADNTHFYLNGTYFNDWRVKGDALGGNGYNRWDSCYVKLDGSVGSFLRAHSDTLIGNVFFLKQPLQFASDSMLFYHNTVVRSGGGKVIEAFGSNTAQRMDRSWLWYNIFMSDGALPIQLKNAHDGVINHNLVYSTGCASTQAAQTVAGNYSIVGGGEWCNTDGRDCYSHWFDPALVSSAWASGDATPTNPDVWSSVLWEDGAGYVGALNPALTAVTYVCPSDTLLTLANAAVKPGDIVSLTAAYYDSTSIDPATSGTEAARITYVANLENAAACSLLTIALDKSYISVKGVRATVSASITTASHDSIVHCDLPSVQLYGAKDCVVAQDSISGSVILSRELGTKLVACERDTIRKNVISVSPLYSGTRYMDLVENTQSCLADSNRITWAFSKTRPLAEGRYLANAYFNTFRDNSVTATADSVLATDWPAFSLRDSSYSNLFLRDTMLLGLTSTVNLIGGSFVAAGIGTHSNRWSQCYYLMNGSGVIAGDFTSSAIDTSVMASKYGSPIKIDSTATLTGGAIKQNSLYTWLGPALRNGWNGGTDPLNLTVSRNIFYTKVPGISGTVGGCHSIEASAENDAPAGSSDYNLYYSTTAAAQYYALSYRKQGFTIESAGVNGGPLGYTVPYIDIQSRWGNPLWADTTFASFDPYSASTDNPIFDNTDQISGLWAREDPPIYTGARLPGTRWAMDTTGASSITVCSNEASYGPGVYEALIDIVVTGTMTTMPESLLCIWDATSCVEAAAGTQLDKTKTMTLCYRDFVGEAYDFMNIPLTTTTTEPANYCIYVAKHGLDANGIWDGTYSGQPLVYRHCAP